MPDFAPKPSAVTAGTLNPGSFITVGASAVTFTAFKMTDTFTGLVSLEVQQANVCCTIDGTAPTVSQGFPTNGHIMYSGQVYNWHANTVQAAQFIALTATSATIQASRLQVTTGDVQLPDTSIFKANPNAVSTGQIAIAVNSQSAAYLTVLSDSGSIIYHPASDGTARTFTIASNASVPYPLGAAISFANDVGAGVVTIAINSDTLVFGGTASTTGSRTLTAVGVATAVKVTSTRWIITGINLT